MSQFFLKLEENLKKLTNKNVLVLQFFLAIVFLLYIVVLNGDFIWDDFGLIVDNTQLGSFSHFKEWFTTSATSGGGNISNVYRPLATMVNSIIVQFFGYDTIVFHGLNILLHGLIGFFLYKLLLNLKLEKIVSLLCVTLFLVHPVHTETVAYIAGLPDLMSSLFIVICLYKFSKEKTGKCDFFLILILCVLAILSKEIGIVIFPLALLLFFLQRKELDASRKKHSLILIGLLGAICFTFIVLKLTVLDFTGMNGLAVSNNIYTENIKLRVLTFFSSYYEYMRLLVYPKTLLFEKAFRVDAAFLPRNEFGLALLIFTCLIAILNFKKKPYLSVGLLWFLIVLIPISGILIPTNAVYYEHWLYIPLMGLAIAAAKHLRINKKSLSVIALILILFSMRTISRNWEWRNQERFLLAEESINKTSPRLYNQLGKMYFDGGQYQRAIYFYTKGIENDKDILFPELRFNLGNSYLALRQLEPAVNLYFTALEKNPNMREPLVALYNVALAIHNDKKALGFKSLIDRRDKGEPLTFEEIRRLSD